MDALGIQLLASDFPQGLLAGSPPVGLAVARVTGTEITRSRKDLEGSSVCEHILEAGEIRTEQGNRALGVLEVEETVAERQVEELLAPLVESRPGRLDGLRRRERRDFVRNVRQGRNELEMRTIGLVGRTLIGSPFHALGDGTHAPLARALDVDRAVEVRELRQTTRSLRCRSLEVLERPCGSARRIEEPDLPELDALADPKTILDDRVREALLIEPDAREGMLRDDVEQGVQSGLLQTATSEQREIEAGSELLACDATGQADSLALRLEARWGYRVADIEIPDRGEDRCGRGEHSRRAPALIARERWITRGPTEQIRCPAKDLRNDRMIRRHESGEDLRERRETTPFVAREELDGLGLADQRMPTTEDLEPDLPPDAFRKLREDGRRQLQIHVMRREALAGRQEIQSPGPSDCEIGLHRDPELEVAEDFTRTILDGQRLDDRHIVLLHCIVDAPVEFGLELDRRFESRKRPRHLALIVVGMIPHGYSSASASMRFIARATTSTRSGSIPGAPRARGDRLRRRRSAVAA